MHTRRGLAGWVIVGVVLCSMGFARAQDGDEDELPPPPPVIQRMVLVAQDPEKFRELMADPQRVAAVMEAMDNDEVRQFMADPRRVAAVMRQVDMLALREAVQSVDRAKVRDALLERWKQRLKERLGAGDEEWKVLEPLILKVVKARRDARVDPRNPAGGRAGGFGAAPVPRDGPSKVDEAEAALREATRDPEVHANDVARSLGDFRQARDAARKKLEEAEAELKAVLTQRQEGVLIVAGVLR
jgi:hypothetical protein